MRDVGADPARERSTHSSIFTANASTRGRGRTATGNPPPASSRAAPSARPSCDHTPPTPPRHAACRPDRTPPGSPSLPPGSSSPPSRHASNTRRPGLQADQDETAGRSDGHPWGDPVAASGDFRWPPTGRFPWPPSEPSDAVEHRLVIARCGWRQHDDGLHGRGGRRRRLLIQSALSLEISGPGTAADLTPRPFSGQGGRVPGGLLGFRGPAASLGGGEAQAPL